MQLLHSKKCIFTDGNDLWSGSQQLRATTPANWYWQVKAVYSDKAPPWKEQFQQKEALRCKLAQIQCYNVEMYYSGQPGKNHRGWYDEGGCHFWPRVQLRPWLDESQKEIGIIKQY